MSNSIVDLAKAIAILDKLVIERNPNLSRAEKECLKQLTDYCQRQIESESPTKVLK